MKRKLTALLLAVWLLVGIAQPKAWASGGEITISSAKELVEFSKNCSLDTWSQGKTFRLTADINLAGAGFAPIPTFGGTFLGTDTLSPACESMPAAPSWACSATFNRARWCRTSMSPAP